MVLNDPFTKAALTNGWHRYNALGAPGEGGEPVSSAPGDGGSKNPPPCPGGVPSGERLGARNRL